MTCLAQQGIVCEPHWPGATVSLGSAHVSGECISETGEQVKQDSSEFSSALQ